MKISVIMPVYNMELYVEEAIESWLEQTIDEKELIIVDDCSTDGTLKIIKKYELENDNIFVYSMNDNQGVGVVRRKAMSLTRGDYIGFLDADDKYFRKDALEILVQMGIEGDCDVVAGLLNNFSDVEMMEYARFRNLFEGKKLFWKDLEYKAFQDDYFFQGFLYRSSFLKEKDINFPALRRNEDPPFLVKALNWANKIRVVNVEYYCHRVRRGSYKYKPEEIRDLLEGFILNLEFSCIYNLDTLRDTTILRLNTEYLEVLCQGLKYQDYVLLEQLIKANKIAHSYGRHIDILDYMSYICNRCEDLDNYKMLARLYRHIAKGKRIILYGAGKIGTQIFNVISDNAAFDIVSWIDHYKSGQIQSEMELHDIQDIQEYQGLFDYVLIGINDQKVSEDVCEIIKSYGVEEERIIKWYKSL